MSKSSSLFMPVALALILTLVSALYLSQPGKKVESWYETYLPLVQNVDLSVAQEQTFVPVAWKAIYSGFNGMSGVAIVAGLQSLVMIGVNSNGSTNAEVRLCKWPDLETPVYTLWLLEQRPYVNEWLPGANPPGAIYLPWYLSRGCADTLVIYGTGPYYGVLAVGVFSGTNDIALTSLMAPILWRYTFNQEMTAKSGE